MVKANSLKITSIYSDGACSGNPGAGGWGVVINFSDGTSRELGGSNTQTTNNQMELAGAIAGLKFWQELDPEQSVQLFTDSKYVIDGITKWIKGWKQNNWQTSSKQPVKNKELWQSLDQLNSSQVSWHWVQGHSGDRDNERCDAIARNEISKANQPHKPEISQNRLETRAVDSSLEQLTVEQLLAKLKFDAKGLIPAIAQDAQDGTVLMMAWMNAESITLTIQTGEVHYWSRSRSELWHKGATSGHIQKVKHFYYDCDADVVLIKIEQVGDIACHTGVRSCFFYEFTLPTKE
jgi:ribonuclease HI/phosphoribosyl-AMP cyclohydrolase